jgi:hypothetical protein
MNMFSGGIGEAVGSGIVNAVLRTVISTGSMIINRFGYAGLIAVVLGLVLVAGLKKFASTPKGMAVMAVIFLAALFFLRNAAPGMGLPGFNRQSAASQKAALKAKWKASNAQAERMYNNMMNGAMSQMMGQGGDDMPLPLGSPTLPRIPKSSGVPGGGLGPIGGGGTSVTHSSFAVGAIAAGSGGRAILSNSMPGMATHPLPTLPMTPLVAVNPLLATGSTAQKPATSPSTASAANVKQAAAKPTGSPTLTAMSPPVAAPAATGTGKQPVGMSKGGAMLGGRTSSRASRTMSAAPGAGLGSMAMTTPGAASGGSSPGSKRSHGGRSGMSGFHGQGHPMMAPGGMGSMGGGMAMGTPGNGPHMGAGHHSGGSHPRYYQPPLTPAMIALESHMAAAAGAAGLGPLINHPMPSHLQRGGHPGPHHTQPGDVHRGPHR